MNRGKVFSSSRAKCAQRLVPATKATGRAPNDLVRYRHYHGPLNAANGAQGAFNGFGCNVFPSGNEHVVSCDLLRTGIHRHPSSLSLL